MLLFYQGGYGTREDLRERERRETEAEREGGLLLHKDKDLSTSRLFFSFSFCP